MTYARKRNFKRKPKDVLSLSLRNMSSGEELLCTKRSYEGMRDRIETLKKSNPRKQFVTIPWGVMRAIKRVA